jgi:putative phage-type endonuclease
MRTWTVFAKTKDMPKAEWLRLRRNGIGGSDAAAIMGLNPWRTAMDVWLEKTGEFTEDESQDNEKMYWGTVLEAVVAEEFTRRTGLKTRRRDAILQSRKYPFMIANVDRLVVGQSAGLECKTAGLYNADDWRIGIPEYYFPQVQHYMAVTGYKAWYVAVLIGGQEFKYYKITRDDSFIRQLIQAETEFWNLVETRIPPPIDGTKASTELIQRLYPEAEKGKEVELPFEAFELIQQYEQACEEEKRIQLIKDEAANRLKDMLGTAEKGFIYDRQVTWSSVTSKKFDSKALKKDHPDIYEQYLNDSSYRRFSIK